MAVLRRKWMFGALVGLMVLGLSGVGIYWACSRKPAFYTEVLRADRARQQVASDEMLSEAASLLNDVRRRDQWSALFTAEQINGWLAVDLPANHPDLLGNELQEPRVLLMPDVAILAGRYQLAGIDVVATIELGIQLTDQGELAIRFRRVRAGAFPLPLSDLLDALTASAQELDLRLRWQREGSDPVAIISLPAATDRSGQTYHLQQIQIRDGAIYLAGITMRPATERSAEPSPPPGEPRFP